MAEYRHQVIEQGTGIYRTLYDGNDAAEAMAIWSKAISDGVEYVTLESMRLHHLRKEG